MSDLTRYRETDVVLTLGIEIQYWQQLSKLMLVPDTTLQDIADAWNDASNTMSGELYASLAYEYPKLVALLEGTDK